MAEAVRARMLDAAAPYVAGRRLRTHGLAKPEVDSLARLADPHAGAGAVVAAGEAPALERDELLILLLPGSKSLPPLAGIKVLEVQYAFVIPYGLSDDTAAPTLQPDPDWPWSAKGAGVWLDIAQPAETLGCLVIAQREP